MNICMKEFISFVEFRQLFPYMAFVYAWMVPLMANQLLLQLLMEQFDTLPIQCAFMGRSTPTTAFDGTI